MATLFRMPEVTTGEKEGTIAAWKKQEGDKVSVGDCLAEIESDKAVIELNADRDGVMGRQLAAAGQPVAIGAPIGVLLAEGETAVDVDALIAGSSGATAAAPNVDDETGIAADTPIPGSEMKPGAAEKSSPVPSGERRLFASPLARRLARERGIDLRGLQGSGPNGRIVKRDIEAATAAPTAPPAPAPAVAPAIASTAAAAPGATDIPHSAMRRIIAQRLSESKATIPHFYLTADCRMDQLLALREQINTIAPRKLSVNDFIVRAVAVALKATPSANVGWMDSALRQYAQADIAVAVATDNGLITPIIRQAEVKSLAAISAEIADLAERARAGRLQPEEYQGGSFTVSNLGMYGVTEFAAIINPPQAGILAVGAVQAQPVVEAGELKVAQVMRVTLSVDHRAIDGAVGAQWLAAFKRLLENPLTILL